MKKIIILRTRAGNVFKFATVKEAKAFSKKRGLKHPLIVSKTKWGFKHY